MILFSSRKLEKALANNSLDEWLKAKYYVYPYIFYLILYGIIFCVTPDIKFAKSSIASLIIMIFNSLIVYAGYNQCFLINKKTGGKNFIENFTILSLPAIIKSTMIFLPLSLITQYAVVLYGKNHNLIIQNFLPAYKTLGALGFVFYFFLVTNSFKRFAEAKNSCEEPK